MYSARHSTTDKIAKLHVWIANADTCRPLLRVDERHTPLANRSRRPNARRQMNHGPQTRIRIGLINKVRGEQMGGHACDLWEKNTCRLATSTLHTPPSNRRSARTECPKKRCRSLAALGTQTACRGFGSRSSAPTFAYARFCKVYPGKVPHPTGLLRGRAPCLPLPLRLSVGKGANGGASSGSADSGRWGSQRSPGGVMTCCLNGQSRQWA